MTHLPLEETKPTSSLRMTLTLTGLSFLCGALILTLVNLTRPLIEANRKEALENAIFRLVPEAKSFQGLALDKGRLKPQEPAELYLALDDTGQAKAYLIPAVGQGYQDLIRLLFAYDPQRQVIRGMTVLESKETPGLGDKIEKDESFLADFRALAVPIEEGRLKADITTVKRGKSKVPGQIDAISGATVSSKAVARILTESGNRWFGLVRHHQSTLDQEAKE